MKYIEYYYSLVDEVSSNNNRNQVTTNQKLVGMFNSVHSNKRM